MNTTIIIPFRTRQLNYLPYFLMACLLLVGKLSLAVIKFSSATVNSAQTICSGSTPSALSYSVVECNTSGGTTYAITAKEWQESDDNGINDKWAKASGGQGVAASTYIPPALTSNKYYRCKLTLSGSRCSGTSTTYTTASVLITVNATVTPTISITANQNSICSGSLVNFTCSIANGGTNPTYQWKKNGSNISNSNSSSYASSSLVDGDIITCQLSSNASCLATSPVTSNSITMDILSGPSITSPPSNAYIPCAGNLATFTISASGSGLSFQWQKVLMGPGTVTNITSGVTTGVTATEGSSILTFYTASGDDNYYYQCVVSNSDGCSTTSTQALLTFGTSGSTIAIGTPPSSQKIVDGCSVSFSVSAEGDGNDLVYQWQKSSTADGSYADISGAESSSYSFIASSADNGYHYRCYVNYDGLSYCGSYSDAAVLTVLDNITDVVTYTQAELTSEQTRYYGISANACYLTSELSSAIIYVQLDLGDDYAIDGTDYDPSETITITPYTSTGASGAPYDITLSLSSTNRQPQSLAKLDIQKLFPDYANYNYFELKFSALSGSSVPAETRVLAWVQEDHNVDVLSGSFSSSPLVSINEVSVEQNNVNFSWDENCHSFINKYQIEILRLFNQNADEKYNAKYVKVDALDWSKALSLEVDNQTSISLDIMEGTGYYLWRVRPIGDYYEGGIADSRNWGVWSTCTISSGSAHNVTETTAEITSSTALPEFIFYFTQQDIDINSIYNRTFTESNRIAQGISFANGLGMLKQSQRKLAEVDSVLLNAAAYDYVGRPAIQSMTAPYNQSHLGYVEKVIEDEEGNLYGPDDFDTEERVQFDDDLDVVPVWENPDRMKGPISEYFSDLNPDLRIPNANDFPYSRTLYHQDGRVKKQSLFGDEHRMGLYDTTYIDGGLQRTIRTYYSAVSDTEVMIVFGNETPRSSGMYKVVRVDPSSTPMVEYKTIDGKTIATAYLNTGQHPLLDDVYDDPTLMIKKEIEGEYQPDPYTIIREQSIAFEIPEVDVYFDYSLSPEEFSAYCLNYCSTCDYTVEIYIIREETDELKYSYPFTLGAESCNQDNNFDDNNGGAAIRLSDPGVYRFGRKITVNNVYSGEDRYADYHADAVGTQMDEEVLSKFQNLTDYLAGTYIDPTTAETLETNLDELNNYLDELKNADSESESGTEIGTDIGNGIGNIGTGNGSFSDILNNSSLDFLSEFDGTVSYDEEADEYTIATACCSVTIPKVACDEDLCGNLWVDDASWDWGGYYDFEGKLVDEAGGYLSVLSDFFYDEHGKYIYPKSNTLTITLQPEEEDNGSLDHDATVAFTSCEPMDGTLTNECSSSLDHDYVTINFKIFGTNYTIQTSPIYSHEADFSGNNGGSGHSDEVSNSYSYAYCERDEFTALILADIQELIDDNGLGGFVNLSSNDNNEIYITYSFSPDDFEVTLTASGGGDNGADSFISSVLSYNSENADYPYGSGSLNKMIMHMLNEEENPYSCTDILIGMEKFIADWPNLKDAKGSVNTTGVNFLDYFIDLCGGKQYVGFSNMAYGEANGASVGASMYPAAASYYTPGTDYGYGFGYLEYAYKSFKLDVIDEADGSIDAIQTNGNANEQIEYCLGLYGIDVANDPSLWTNPKGDSDSEADTATVWDAETCGAAWWDGSSLIADDKDEDQQCKAWEQLYACLRTDIAIDQDLLDITSCSTADEACSDAMQAAIDEQIAKVIDVRMNAIKNNAGTIDQSLSQTQLMLLRDGLRDNFKSKFAHINDVDETDKTALINYASNIKNMVSGTIDLSFDEGKTDYTYIGSISKKNTTIFQEQLTNKINAIAYCPTEDEINNWMNEITNEYAIESESYKNSLFKNSTTELSSTTKGTFSTFSNQVRYKQGTTTTTILNFSTNNATHAVNNLGYKVIPRQAVTFDGIRATQREECSEENIEYVLFKLESELAQCRQDEIDSAISRYTKACTLPEKIVDTMIVEYGVDYTHFTLFYYDVAGNLIKTVSPKGTDQLDMDTDGDGKVDQRPSRNQENAVKNHSMASEYQYNSLGQRVKESTPDGGEKEFWYNSLGQLRFSQNAKQVDDNNYSYIKYDALGRIIESGLSTLDASSQTFFNNVDDDTYPTSGLSYRTVSVYDEEVSGLSYKTDATELEQHYLQNRISYVYSDYNGTDKDGDENFTYYSYDAHGNVEWMLQDLLLLNNKHIAYEYDLISGKVTKVKYNEGMNDQFFHQYIYDSDNRIEKVQTSRDGEIWETDAEYQYYAYGPLKRLSVGEDHIQGIDYVYTINGWLKAMNHQSLDAAFDPGADGNTTSSTAKDVLGMSLGYFDGDFKRGYDSNNDGTIDQFSPFNSDFYVELESNPSPYINTGVNQHDWYTLLASENEESGTAFPSYKVNYRPLYNGNITHLSYNQETVTGSGSTFQFSGKPLNFMYNYDELYRLTQASFDYFDATNNRWYRDGLSSGTYNTYKSKYEYDENGNIKTLDRYTFSSTAQIDDLSYTYNSGNNQLNYITDSKTTATNTTDLETQDADNYQYDEIGELISDNAESISNITWTPSGKVKTAQYTNGSYIVFGYDGMDNRIAKTFFDKSSGSYVTTITYYVYDANGKVMAIYEDPSGSEDDALVEIPLYAGNRMGEFKPELSIDDDVDYPSSDTYLRTVGDKRYELNDYLGNVRAIVTDVKTPVSGGGYTANVTTSNDYYPYGMLLPGRNEATNAYRYGYQGKEMDDEMKGKTGTSYDFGARILDPRVGRWLSMDPLAAKFPSESPYHAMGNDPINMVDPDGMEDTKCTGVTLTVPGITPGVKVEGSYIAGAYVSTGRTNFAFEGGICDDWSLYGRIDAEGTIIDVGASGGFQEGLTGCVENGYAVEIVRQTKDNATSTTPTLEVNGNVDLGVGVTMLGGGGGSLGITTDAKTKIGVEANSQLCMGEKVTLAASSGVQVVGVLPITSGATQPLISPMQFFDNAMNNGEMQDVTENNPIDNKLKFEQKMQDLRKSVSVTNTAHQPDPHPESHYDSNTGQELIPVHHGPW